MGSIIEIEVNDGVYEIRHSKYGYLVIEMKPIEKVVVDSWGKAERQFHNKLLLNGVDTDLNFPFENIKNKLSGCSFYHKKILSELHKEIFPEQYI